MNKEFLKKLEEVEKRSMSLCAGDSFEDWMAEHYPNRTLESFDFLELMEKVPKEISGPFFKKAIDLASNKSRELVGRSFPLQLTH